MTATDDRIRIRIDSEDKARAVEMAEQQGVTLSDALRSLLALWVGGHIDLGELLDSPRLPAEQELQELGQALDAMVSGVNAGRDALDRFVSRHKHALAMKEALDSGYRFELPAWMGRL